MAVITQALCSLAVAGRHLLVAVVADETQL
jgi:hypothetical protein